MNETTILAAAREWSEARSDCLRTKDVTAQQYDCLANAEAALQEAVRNNNER